MGESTTRPGPLDADLIGNRLPSGWILIYQDEEAMGRLCKAIVKAPQDWKNRPILWVDGVGDRLINGDYIRMGELRIRFSVTMEAQPSVERNGLIAPLRSEIPPSNSGYVLVAVYWPEHAESSLA